MSRWGGLDPGRLLLTGDKNPKSEESDQDPLFLITGNNVRIEGLRFQGPIVTYKEEDRAPTLGFDTAIRILETYNVVIENNDFSFWNQAVLVNPPRMTAGQANLIRITRNYFHRNANERHGYGVVLGSPDGYVAIEGNLFTHNRHAVAASGEGLGGYIARYNYVLEGGFTVCWPCHWNQHFDVHGEKDGGYGGRAREYFEIAYNTIRGEQQYSVVPFTWYKTRPAFMLRGKPAIGAFFHDNVVVHNSLDAAVALVDTRPPNTGIGEDHSKFNFVPGVPDRNVYNTDTSSDFAVGDFDGDGRDDVFLANGTGWWYSSAGKTEWRFLRASPLRIKDLRFGRFDSDAKTDVLFVAGGAGGDWYVSSGGQSEPKRVRGGGTGLTECVFGDFDGDGITDALRANGTTWSVAPAAQGPWILKRNSRVAAVNLRTGDFMGAGHDQIFWIDDAWSLWDPVSNAETGDHRNPLRRSDFAPLVVADFDGDGTADVAQTKGSGWRWIRGGTNTWAPLRGAAGQYYYKNIREVVLGRFTPGDRRFDAVRYEMLPDPYRPQPSPFIPGRNFVVWKGFGSPDAFEPWTPPCRRCDEHNLCSGC